MGVCKHYMRFNEGTLAGALSYVYLMCCVHFKQFRQIALSYLSRNNTTNSLSSFISFTRKKFLNTVDVFFLISFLSLIFLRNRSIFFFSLTVALGAYRIPPCFPFWKDRDGAEFIRRRVYKMTDRRSGLEHTWHYCLNSFCHVLYTFQVIYARKKTNKQYETAIAPLMGKVHGV